MTSDTYDKLVLHLDAVCKEIISRKRPEYTSGVTDVLRNFKRASENTGISPLQVAFVFLDKHIASIGQICAGKGGSEPDMERLADARNYIDIIWALINESRNFQESGKDPE